MDLTPEQIDELLGAWALDALDASDAAIVDAPIASDPALAGRADELRDVVAAIAGSDGVPPHEVMRAELLAEAAAWPRPSTSPSDPAVVFANQVDALHTLLSSLADDEWDRAARPYDWTVHGLVAHLLVIERYTAGQLGLAPPWSDDGPSDHLGIGAATIAEQLTGSGRSTAASWHAAAVATASALEGRDRPDPDATVDFHGWPFTIDGLLVARGFEIWTHTDDIRRATDRPTVPPTAPDLRAMSRASVTGLPLVLPLVADDASFGGARVVLTGEGGGTFDIGDPDRRDAVVVADVVDYCRLAARRIPADHLRVDVEGDRETAEHLLAAAQVFAV